MFRFENITRHQWHNFDTLNDKKINQLKLNQDYIKIEFLIKKINIINALYWCPEPESNRHTHKARDFKSLVSTNFTTRAGDYCRTLCGAYFNTNQLALILNI